ncbi:MAG TPA: hypothetical protein VM911_21335 [Pyrinomonadaceae bacterium]|jgi:hypothetical protein|nr:hypothetical protein [Pyrinomonadaceae bacterium]
MLIEKRRAFVCLLIFLFFAQGASLSVPGAQDSNAQLALAQTYFDEAASICGQDQGKLWRVSLCGPMMFVEPQTRMVYANRADAQGRLIRKVGVFTGRLPDEINIANTATEWAGVKWTMIMWGALSPNKYGRARLMLHEMFHRIQSDIGFPASNPSNNHLDTMEARIWLQLEWRALREAVTHLGKERQRAATDAILFRLYRRELFPQGSVEERALEMNEGLAEYTGVTLSGRTALEMPGYLAGRLDQAVSRPSFVRSFAYETGPAYGFLLDQMRASWRAHLKSQDDLGDLLRQALSVKLPESLRTEAIRRSIIYQGDDLRAAEEERERDRQARLKAYRARLVEGPVLIIPLSREMSFSFDPNNLLPLDNSGTIYPTLRVADDWGVLEVDGGALMIRDREQRPTHVHVPVPVDTNARPLKGEGWTLQLAEGWRLEESTTRKGDYVLMPKAEAAAKP